MAISGVAVVSMSRGFSVLWDEQLYPEQKRAPCPHVTPGPADLLSSSPATKNLPECSCWLPMTHQSVQKRLRDLSLTGASCLYSAGPTFSLRCSWVPDSVAAVFQSRGLRVGSQEVGKDFCQGLWGWGGRVTERTTAIWGKTLTTFLGWDRSLHYTAQRSRVFPLREHPELRLERKQEGRAGLTPRQGT